MSHSDQVVSVIHTPISRVGLIIGPRGGTIDNIRKIYQVQINIPRQRRSKSSLSDQASTGPEATIAIKIRGAQSQVDSAVEIIQGLISSKQHLTPTRKRTEIIHIPKDYHDELIGKNGQNVKRLEKRYAVRIVFGRPLGDDTDAECELSPGTSNSVLIRGDSDGIENAKEELLELYKFVLETHKSRATKPSFVWVSTNAVSGIIGREGRMIKSIQQETDTTIRISAETDWAPNNATVSLLGTASDVATATRRIQGIEAKVNREVIELITLDPKYYRNLSAPEVKP